MSQFCLAKCSSFVSDCAWFELEQHTISIISLVCAIDKCTEISTYVTVTFYLAFQFNTHQDITSLFWSVVVLNCIRLLTRIVPYIFEDVDWSGFFWSPVPHQSESIDSDNGTPLAHSLLESLCVSSQHPNWCFSFCTFKVTCEMIVILHLNSLNYLSVAVSIYDR